MIRPQTQKKLTNIATVRLKSHGKRFEIACYKNKVVNWRDGTEKDINEVIQTDTIFENVERGIWAKEKDLKKVFGTIDPETICRKILKEGEFQVSDKERETQLESLFRDVATFVVEKCVNPQSGRQLTLGLVESALHQIHFAVKPDKPMKPQALKAIEQLCKAMPESIERAKMRLRLACPAAIVDEIKKVLTGDDIGAQIDSVSGADGATASITFQCDPRHYRELDRLATSQYSEQGVSLQVVSNIVVTEGTSNLGVVPSGELRRPQQSSSDGASVEGPGRPAAAGGYAQPLGAAPRAAAESVAKAAPTRKMACSTCSVEFDDAAGYRAHCKSEWHNFNLKRKVKGLAPVSDEDFREIALDIREGFIAVDA